MKKLILGGLMLAVLLIPVTAQAKPDQPVKAGASAYLSMPQAKRAITKYAGKLIPALEGDADNRYASSWYASNCNRWSSRKVWCTWVIEGHSYVGDFSYQCWDGAYAVLGRYGRVTVHDDAAELKCVDRLGAARQRGHRPEQGQGVRARQTGGRP
jgi:hypothetical protein